MSQTLRTLARLLRFGASSRGLVFAAFGCMVVLGLTTGIYAALLGPVMKFLLTGEVDRLGRVGEFLPALAELTPEAALWALPLAIVGIGLIKGASYLGQFYWMGLFGQRLVGALRRALFDRLIRLSPTERAGAKTGDLLSRFSSDVQAVELFATYTIASYVRDGLQIVILLGVALSIHWKVALGTLVIVPLAAVPVSRLTRSFLRRSQEGQGRLGVLAAQVQEGLGGLKTLQAYGATAAELRRFEAQAALHERAVVRATWARGAVPGLMEIFAALGIALALAYAVSSSALPSEDLISLVSAVVLMYQPAKDLGRVGQFALLAKVSGDRIFELLDLSRVGRARPRIRSLARLSRGVHIQDVHFAYGDRPALRGASLELRCGEVIAVVGPSGGGKSTLTWLLMGFEEPQDGRILLDGEDITLLSVESVRRQFALVTQEALLFSDTLLENIRFGRPEATLEEVEAAARVARADGFIRALPNGYLTQVGERGLILSGGQKQRICLARAVLADAPVLILDEATSNLDPESEREVQAALGQVLQGRSAILIAHRLETTRSAARLYVLEAGKVVEEGTHEALLQRSGLYARMWQLQTGGTREKVA